LEGINGFNVVDIIITVVFLYFIIRGYERGFIDQTSKIIGLFVALFVAIQNYESFNIYLEPYFELPLSVMYFMSFAIIFIAVNLVIHILGAVLKQAVNFLFLSLVDSTAGAILGLVKGGLLVYLLLFILNEIPHQGFLELLNSSYLARHMLEFTPLIQENMEEFFGHI